MNSSQKDEIKLWVQECLKKENLINFEISNLRYPNKGEGAIGDIIFLDLEATRETGSRKKYNLALKCSKNNKNLREKSPMVLLFHNEIHVYHNIISEFKKFQLNRGMQNFFDSIPKYYGHYFGEYREVIAFENIGVRGYNLWEKSKPMTRQHIELVLKEYARFHSISAAMLDQTPQDFEKLTKPFDDLIINFIKQGNVMIKNFCRVIEEVYELLQGELDDKILAKWSEFGKKMEKIFINLILNCNSLKVVTHGDCWNNNFLFYCKSNDEALPTKVSILDWQLASFNTPILDLSHFLFSCISEKDLQDLESILDYYHKNFVDCLVEMKSDPRIYPKQQFLEDWKTYSCEAIMMIPMVLKICSLEKEEGIDVGEASSHDDFQNAFMFKLKNTEKFKKRIKPIVKYVVENELI